MAQTPTKKILVIPPPPASCRPPSSVGKSPSAPVVATPVVATPVVATPVVATPVVAVPSVTSGDSVPTASPPVQVSRPSPPSIPAVKIQVIAPPVLTSVSKPGPTLVLAPVQVPVSAPVLTVRPGPVISPAVKAAPVGVTLPPTGSADVPIGPIGPLLTDQYVPRSGLIVWKNFSCMLSQVDISANMSKFYCMQVLTDGNQYFYFTRYGRIGEKGRCELKPMPNAEASIDAFISKFKSQTGNIWGNPFVAKPGKYTLLEIEAPQIKETRVVSQGSTLPEKLGTFIGMISNKQMFERTFQTFEIDTQRMPLGKIGNNQLNSAEALLRSIERSIATRDPDLVTLSSQFWTIIPYATKRNAPPPLIETQEALNKAAEMLDALRHMSIAGAILERRNNLDDIYRSLMTDISVVDRNSSDWGQMTTYINNSHGSTHRYRLEMRNLFRVGKPSFDALDTSNHFASIPNHRLLFHGSRMSNFVGILSEGLRLPRPEQIVNGAMFGPGIYFANSVTKSFNYTNSQETQHCGFLLICEVALGRQEKVMSSTTSPLPASFDSRMGCGKSIPDPQGDTPWVGNATVTVPCGRLISTLPSASSSLLYDEFIIFNKFGYRIRYIAELVQSMSN